jgi:hypothetical protein
MERLQEKMILMIENKYTNMRRLKYLKAQKTNNQKINQFPKHTTYTSKKWLKTDIYM